MSWQKVSGKWHAHLSLKGKKQKYAGSFSNEMDAAKRVNQLCQEMEIPLRNPGITEMPNELSQVTQMFVCFKIF